MEKSKIKVKKLREQSNIIYDEGYQQATADFIKMINNEIAETPNDNDCCRGFLINLKQMLVEKNAKT